MSGQQWAGLVAVLLLSFAVTGFVGWVSGMFGKVATAFKNVRDDMIGQARQLRDVTRDVFVAQQRLIRQDVHVYMLRARIAELEEQARSDREDRVEAHRREMLRRQRARRGRHVSSSSRR